MATVSTVSNRAFSCQADVRGLQLPGEQRRAAPGGGAGAQGGRGRESLVPQAGSGPVQVAAAGAWPQGGRGNRRLNVDANAADGGFSGTNMNLDPNGSSSEELTIVSEELTIVSGELTIL